MKVLLVSHASVIISTADARIWTDPWLHGKAFNDSWSLFPEPAWDPAWLNEIDHVWISHEHPDHFHIPTLRSLPAAFKERVTVLFQRNNSDKMFEAMRRLGFRNFRALPHRKRVQLTPTTEVYCYQEGLMNSCLAVISGGRTILNVNDAEIRTPDCKLIVRDIGPSDVVLNQFSIAGYSGETDREARLRKIASGILDNVCDNHRDLGAKLTIPFASFIYFSSEDNRYINDYANDIDAVVRRARERNIDVAVLYPGDELDTERSYDSAPALARFEAAYRSLPSLPYDRSAPVPLVEIEGAFRQLVRDLRDRYTPLVLRGLRPMRVHLTDIDARVEFSLATGAWRLLPDGSDADLVVKSQPFFFALKFPFGVQTLGVSARFSIQSRERNWRLHRILFALNNAELYLRPKYLLSAQNLGYFRARLQGGVTQLRQRLATM